MAETSIRHHQHRLQSETALLDSGLGVLFLAAFPLVMMLVQGSGAAFAAMLQLGLLLLGLRLIHRGHQIRLSYDSTPGSRAPRLPRKLLGAIVIGLMVTLLAGHHFGGLVLPLSVGALASGLAVAAFGADPLRDRTDLPRAEPAAPDVPAPLVNESLDRIEARLDEMVREVAALGDAEALRQVEALRGGAMGLIRVFCRDPEGLRRIRRPVVRFVEILRRENAQLMADWAAGEPLRARRRYIARITALGETFEERMRRAGARSGRDAFELEADLLWSRMPAQRAA